MEKFKRVKGYEDLYEVSDLGVVRSFTKRYIIPSSGGLRVREAQVLSQQTMKTKYKTLKLSKDNKVKRFKVHRLVAIAFIPNPENKPQVNHINGVKNDNRAVNLEWSTAKENMRHAYVSGVSKRKLDKEKVLLIREDDRSLLDIAYEYGVSFQTVSEVKLRKTWKNV